jgi:hypothetical protein
MRGCAPLISRDQWTSTREYLGSRCPTFILRIMIGGMEALTLERMLAARRSSTTVILPRSGDHKPRTTGLELLIAEINNDY